MTWNPYKRLRSSILWVAALNAAAREDYAGALKKLEQCHKYGIPLQSQFCLLNGFLYYATSQNQLAVETLTRAHRSLRDDNRLSEQEQRYLMCYASIWGMKAAAKLGSGNDRELFAVSYDEVALNQVRKHLKANFPLRDHPDWVEP